MEWLLDPDRMLAKARAPFDPLLESVYLRRGIVLIHIPKNAGTSIEATLYNHSVRHRTWREVREDCPLAWATLPKIAIVRDPVDRFLSAYDYLRAGGRNETDRTFGMLLIGDRSIDAFTARLATAPRFRSQAMQYFHFRPQSDYVCDGDAVMVDELIPLHRMAARIRALADVPLARIRDMYAAYIALYAKAYAA